MAQPLLAKHLLRKIFFEDWGLKLVAIAITLALWLGVTGLSTPTTKRLTVPLVPNISNNSGVTNTLPHEVDIVVSGDRSRINQLNRGDLTASLDLTDVQPGERTVSLTPDNVYVNLPQGVKLVEIAPSRIAVNIEAVLEKDMDVEAATKGAPAAGYEVYSLTVTPPRIRVRGPVSLFGTLDSVQADQIDVTGKKEDFTARQVAVSVTSPKAAVLNTVVDVFVTIGEKRIERAFTMPIPGSPGNTVSFVVYGPRSVLMKIKTESVKVELTGGDNYVVGAEPVVTLPSEMQSVAEIRRLKSTIRRD